MAVKYRMHPVLVDELGRELVMARAGAWNGPIQNEVDIYTVDTVQKFPLGSRLTIGERVFRYAEFGGTVGAGSLAQAEAPAALHDNLQSAATAAGATQVTINPRDTGADDVIASEYAGGYLLVQDAAGEGHAYAIKDNSALDVGATGNTGTVDLWDAIEVALTTSSILVLIKSPYKEVIVAPTTLTAKVVGVSVVAQADGQFGWIQTKGPAAVLTNGTVIIGQQVVPSGTTAGAVDVWVIADTGAVELPMLGTVMDVGATTEYSLVYLNCEQ